MGREISGPRPGGNLVTELDAVLVDPTTAVAVNGLGTCGRSLYQRTRYELVETRAADVVDANASLLDTTRACGLKVINPDHDLTAAVQHAKVRPLVEGETLDKHRAERDLAPLAALELAVCLLMSRELMDDILNAVLRVPRWPGSGGASRHKGSR